MRKGGAPGLAGDVFFGQTRYLTPTFFLRQWASTKEKGSARDFFWGWFSVVSSQLFLF
jgi:hypothetical protein